MRTAAAVLALAWLAAAAAIQVVSYLPFDPEWTLLPTAALFATTFLVGAIGAYFMAPELTLILRWPAQMRHWFMWLGAAWAIYTLFWFVALFTVPGVPTHCATPGFPACGHAYVFNNHGFLTVTDRSGFLGAVRVLVRVFASLPIAVFSLILMAYQARRGGWLFASPAAHF